MGVWTPAAPLRQPNIFLLLTILVVSSVTQFNLNFVIAQNQNQTQENLTFLNTSQAHPPLSLDSNISSNFTPPRKWKESWKSTDKDPQRKHNKELTRVYSDSNIAFYFDPDVDQNITWPFQIVSEAWDYAKRTYGPFGPDPNPLLYIILHEEEHVGFPLTSRTSNYTDVTFQNRHVIDCGRAPGSGSGSGNSWTIPNNSVNMDQILIEMGTIIQKTARETGNWPGWAVSEFKMSEILLYDIYLNINRTEDADRVKKERLTTSWDIPQPRKAIYWFRDWYLPIYENYGGASALNSIFTQLYSDWEQNCHNYVADMNDGEFVHFWSGAVGDDLEYLAIQTLGWSLSDRKELQDAQNKFPNFNYSYNNNDNDNSNSNLTRRRSVIGETWKENWHGHKEVLTLLYVNKYAAFYIDNSVDRGVKWPFGHFSSAWEYVQGIYGSFGSDPLLYVNLHQGKHYGCITSREYSFADPQFGDRNVIDCGDYATVWKTETQSSLIKLVTPLALLVQRGASARGNFPGVQVANCKMSDIILFDIFLNGLKDRGGIAKLLIDQKMEEEKNFPREKTAWFKDWFYPIYVSCEGATVLNNFFKQLSENWPTTETGTRTGTPAEGNNGRDYLHQLNIGEFVHFWSGAAGRSLKHLANQTFDWNDESESQFRKAQEMYSNVTYTTYCNYNDSNSAQTTSQPIILYEQWNGHNEIVYRVHSDKQVTIYYDKFVNRSIVWPFTLASQAWSHVTRSYKVVQEQPLLSSTIGTGIGDGGMECDYNDTTTNQKSHLYVILHAGIGPVNQTASSKSPLYNFRNVIDCGKSSSKAWEQNEANFDFLMIQIAQVIQKSVSQNTNGAEVKYDDLAPMLDIIVYDIYLKLGRMQDANRWLNHTMKGRKLQVFGGVKFWMQDWYYPIYSEDNQSGSGSGGTGVLDKFLFILNENKARISDKELSIGECVHFWSVAVGKSLFTLANSAFPSTKELRDSFNKAQVDFPRPQFSYTCYDCKGEDGPFPVFPISVTIFLALGVILGVPLSIYIHKLRQKIQVLTTEEVRQFFEGDFGGSSHYIEAASVTGPDELYSLIKSMPFNRQYELPRHRLVIYQENILGSGEFGVVLQGLIKRKGSDEDIIVAVKTVKPEVDIIYFKALLSELKILGYLGRHENIASLLGSFTDNIKNREVYVALEFCENGDLLQFLRANSNKFQDLLTAKKRSFRRTVSFTSPPSSRLSATSSLNAGKFRNSLQSTYITLPDQFVLTTVDLVELSRQISNGMKYISSRNIIHGDLAARNILLTRNNVAKISDFGLSRQLVNYSHYTKQSTVPLPWRWMAIESLRNLKFSIHSDMWGFGVILYEIFTLGATPYAGWTWDYEFVDKLTAGQRLASPEFCNEEIYSLMKACWMTEPSSRISFAEMTERLRSIKVQLDPKSDEVMYVDIVSEESKGPISNLS